MDPGHQALTPPDGFPTFLFQDPGLTRNQDLSRLFVQPLILQVGQLRKGEARCTTSHLALTSQPAH